MQYTKTLQKEIKTSEKYQQHPERLESPEHEAGYYDGLCYALNAWKNYDLQKQIKAAIRCWILANFGKSELDDPSYNIAELTQAITNAIKGGDNE